MNNLETKGFFIIKNFLNCNLIKNFSEEYYLLLKSKFNTLNKNYYLPPSKINLAQHLYPVVQEIYKTTNLKSDCFFSDNGVYFSNDHVVFNWHQDHEPYYLWQDSYHSLNFWIPIIKPDSKTSGLQIIPQNILEEKFTDLYNFNIKGKGAKRIIFVDNNYFIIDDMTDEKILLDVNPDLLSITPELNEGDLLILRHDVFHKTQDKLTNRVAISIRTYNSKSVLSKDVLMSGGNTKRSITNNNPKPYADLKNFFEHNNLNECFLGEYFAYLKNKNK